MVTKTVQHWKNKKAISPRNPAFLGFYHAKPTFGALRTTAYLCLFVRLCSCHDNRQKEFSTKGTVAPGKRPSKNATSASRLVAPRTLRAGNA